MPTHDRLHERIEKIDQEIANLKSSIAKRIAELEEKRKPLVDKRRSRDRAADAHCLSLYASTALALVQAGDVDAHELSKRILRRLRETPRHKEALRHWPRLERAFAGFRSARNALGDGTPALSAE